MGPCFFGPKWFQIGAQKRPGIHFWGGSFFDHFFDYFWVISGAIFEPFWDQIRPRRSQDGTKRAMKSFKAPKSIIFKKCDFTTGKPYFSRLGGRQDEHKRLGKAPKRQLKSFKTSQKKVIKMELKKVNFWSSFGITNRSKIGWKFA